MRIYPLLLSVFLAPLAMCAATVSITVLATTDLHGNLLPYDYFQATPANRGLAKLATIAAAVRLENPNTLLIDCGDVIQGAPLEGVYQHYVRSGSLPLGLHLAAPLPADPMMLAMNLMRYDAMVLGNHEFNYGLKNLDRARNDARFPWLSANTHVEAGSKNRPFEGYVIKTVAGVKIAIVGVTTPSIPMWEEPSNFKGYSFAPIRDTVARVVADLKATQHPALIVVAAHSGLGHDIKTGAAEAGELAGENAMYEVAMSVPGVDAVVFGHTHNQLASAEVNGVLLMQPKNWGMSLGRMDFTLEGSEGNWAVRSKRSRLLPANDTTVPDPAILALAGPYQEVAERYLRTPVAITKVDLSSALSRVQDTAVIDAIQEVQLAEAKADVSFASAFNTRVAIPAGPVTVRQVAALYLYDNTLVAIQGNGKMVRDALENAATYFLPCSEGCAAGPLINRKMPGFNYDMAQGVEYEIDISQSPGSRIRNLRWHGKPLEDTQPLRIAVNNYRAGGSAGYGMFRTAKVLWRSTEEIRDLIIRYYAGKKTLPPAPDNNWKILPTAAATELVREARIESRRVFTQ